MVGEYHMRTRAQFKLFIPLICFILGFWNGKYTRNCAETIPSSQSKVINQIYEEAMARSQEAFSKNGGIIDASVISLGHGPKIRIWDYFGPNFNCISKERVGKIGDGGKWLCGVRTVLAQKTPCIVYSIGSKGEVSFEMGVENKLPNCEIHIFDPTLTFNQRRNIDSSLQKFEFHDVGLGGTDGELRIKSRKILWTQKTRSVYPVQSLESLMANFGHAWIDVLKIDIEGGEWNVFAKLCEEARPIPATQVQIELHFMGDAKAVLNFFQCMGQKGFRVFSVEPNYYGRTAENARLMVEYSFIQVDQGGTITWEGSYK
ncbi:unnamed protein product [Bathycoccus prasinos]